MRTQKSIKNLLYAFCGQIIGIVISFLARIIFLQELSTEYLGVNNLFLNIVAILSLAELGIGSAIIFNLYKPLAAKDTEKVKTLMSIYAKFYRYIGASIFILGLILTPFVTIIMKETPKVEHLNFIFILFVLNTSLGYFFSYKKSIIIADQNSYITTFYRYVYYIFYNIIQIIILILFGNFILYLMAQILMNFLENYFISRKANKMYPYLLDKNIKKLDSESKKELFGNIKALFLHKIGMRLNLSSDNILISSLIGVYWVGIYANYLLIISAFHLMTEQLLAAITASIGNLKEDSNRENKIKVYRNLYFGNYFIFSIMSICLYFLLNPFISIWIGSDFIIENHLIILIVINFYLIGIRKVNISFKDAFGLFKQDKYRPLGEAFLNIILSILLSFKFGISGIFLGSIISNLMTSFWMEPYVLFKYGLNLKMNYYFSNFLKLTGVTIISCLITELLMRNNYFENPLYNFIAISFVCLLSSLILNSVFFIRSSEFIYYLSIFKKIFLKYQLK